MQPSGGARQAEDITRAWLWAIQEIVEWLARPENLQGADSLPPFIENF